MAIQAIIFDCFGVLVVSGMVALQHDFPEFSNELHDLRVRSDYGYISREDYNQAVSNITGIPIDQVESRYWKKSVRNESALDWVKSLKAAGHYKVSLLSNIGVAWIDDFLSLSERQQLFDDEVLSGVVGLLKPDRTIFQLAADRLGVDTSECVMIDDVLENIDGAVSAGMQGIVYNTTPQAQQDLERLLEQARA